MANNRVTRVLQNMGFGALAQNFEDQKLDNVELLDSLTDNELNSLGLKTIGDRATFRSNVRKESTTFSSANTRDRGNNTMFVHIHILIHMETHVSCCLSGSSDYISQK